MNGEEGRGKDPPALYMQHPLLDRLLFDEKIGGSLHMALGVGYPESGSVNKSSIHWDMVCDLKNGGEIHVDDELVYKNGEFVVEL